MKHEPKQSFAVAKPYQQLLQPVDQVVEDHLGLVRKIAWHVYPRQNPTVEIEDLIQIGLVALVEAAQNYADLGFNFATYASTRIRGAMIDELRRISPLSRQGMKLRREIEHTRCQLEQELCGPPSDTHIAERMGLSLSELHARQRMANKPEQSSIDAAYSDHDLWFADQTALADTQIEQEQFAQVLTSAIANLPHREALILQLYFIEELNLDEIGKICGIGAARVCQLKKAALEKLKAIMAENYAED